MKKLICIILVGFTLIVCADEMTIDGVTYDTYGFLNKEENKDPNIKYEVSIGNVIWSCILVETIIAPIYFFGFSLLEPIGIK